VLNDTPAEPAVGQSASVTKLVRVEVVDV
jgi:hypothetical protein